MGTYIDGQQPTTHLEFLQMFTGGDKIEGDILAFTQIDKRIIPRCVLIAFVCFYFSSRKVLVTFCR